MSATANAVGADDGSLQYAEKKLVDLETMTNEDIDVMESGFGKGVHARLKKGWADKVSYLVCEHHRRLTL